MKYYKKIFIIVLCLLTMFTVYKIVKTYSLFESNISSTKNIDVSAWNITVNNQISLTFYKNSITDICYTLGNCYGRQMGTAIKSSPPYI